MEENSAESHSTGTGAQLRTAAGICARSQYMRVSSLFSNTFLKVGHLLPQLMQLDMPTYHFQVPVFTSNGSASDPASANGSPQGRWRWVKYLDPCPLVADPN